MDHFEDYYMSTIQGHKLLIYGHTNDETEIEGEVEKQR